ncbi:PIN2/TERF1-interacting telomerase inhibitor 1-like [Centruroides vittatus]|uniref:PIN2/TERF1-interacting telomerase inhibitor 1-like n=1 Tax=Centruroides vittatus TaxID=120091 RepID=UPI00350F6082
MPRNVKLSLNPNGNLWAKDKERFGFKMLTKMGWKDGKGLGKNEDGNTSHIKVSNKDDRKGVGFVGAEDDWIAHQDDFNSLLLSLNGHFQSKETDTTEKPEPATKTKKLQISKFRIYYKKFFKGKDMSNYSSNDLDAILGKKKKKVSKTTKERLKQLLNDDLYENTYTSKKSIQEYFSEKMGNHIIQNKKIDDNEPEDNTNKSVMSDASCENVIDSKLTPNGFSVQSENLDEYNPEISEGKTEMCSSPPSDTGLNEDNKSYNKDTVSVTKLKICNENKSSNTLTERVKKGKKRKHLEQDCNENSMKVTAMDTEVADKKTKNSFRKKKAKRERNIEVADSKIDFHPNFHLRRKVYYEIREFADTFPNSSVLSTIEKCVNLHNNVNNSMIGTSNLLFITGYGNGSLADA